MSTLKTTKDVKKSVKKFLAGIEHEKRRADAQALCALIEKTTMLTPFMWGESIVGFGSYWYSRKGKKEVLHEWFVVGFSPRKAALVLYCPPCFTSFKKLVADLGKVKSSVSCIYITDLNKIDAKGLRTLISASVKAGESLNEK